MSTKTKTIKSPNKSGLVEKKAIPNNGHVCYNAAEAKALDELFKNEKHRSENFKINLYSLTRDRNPLLAEPTPREGYIYLFFIQKFYVNKVILPHTGEGEPIINSAVYLLSTESPTRRLKKEIPNKIGTRPEKYEILGNNKKYDIK